MRGREAAAIFVSPRGRDSEEAQSEGSGPSEPLEADVQRRDDRPACVQRSERLPLDSTASVPVLPR